MVAPAGFVGTTGGPPPSSLGPPPIDLGVDPSGVRRTFESIARIVAGFFPFLPDRRRAPPPPDASPDVEFPGGFELPFPFPFPTDPRVGEGGFIIETGTDIAQLPRDPRIPAARITRIPLPPPLIPLPRGGSGDDDMAELPPFFGSGPGFDIFDIPDIAGRILGNVNAPFGGFGGAGQTSFVQAQAAAAGAANGGVAVNGACPPPRARMPSSILADDPCSPQNPTIYVKAGKASAALWPQLLRSQSKKVSVANKAVRRPARRKRGK